MSRGAGFPYTPFSEILELLTLTLMSAYGYKRTFTHTVIYVRFTPESRHLGGSR